MLKNLILIRHFVRFTIFHLFDKEIHVADQNTNSLQKQNAKILKNSEVMLL
jgi:hypothetical protein